MSRPAPSPPSRLDRPVASLRRYAGEYAAHAHPHAQVLIGLEGRLELELDGRGACVDASSALVVPPGVAHAYLARRPARVVVIDSPLRRGLDRVRRFAVAAPWRDAACAFDAEAAVEAVAGAPTLLPRRAIDLARLDSALGAALHRPWTTADMAALCSLSPQRFHARFVELTGRTPGEWLRGLRLDEAERLLRAGLSLEAAALQVGYASASALAFALRRERGVGARALRRRP